MALSTLHAHAEEQLSHIFKLLLGLFDSFVPRHRRIRDHGARGREQFSHHLIVGLVRQQTVSHPRIECKVGRDIAGVVTAIL